MKYIYIICVLSLILGSCSGWNNGDKELGPELFANKQDYEKYKEAIRNNEKVYIEGELQKVDKNNKYPIRIKKVNKIPTVFNIDTQPVSASLVTLAKEKINGVDEGSFVVMDFIREEIERLTSVDKLRDSKTGMDIPNKYKNSDKFGFFIWYGEIKPSMLVKNHEYRKKLIKNLNDNYNGKFDKLKEINKNGSKGKRTVDQVLNEEFLGRIILFHQLTYNKELIPHLQYYLASDTGANARLIPTIFDVSAVCPPVCP